MSVLVLMLNARVGILSAKVESMFHGLPGCEWYFSHASLSLRRQVAVGFDLEVRAA